MLTKDLQRKTAALQKKVMVELKKAKVMTKESYEDLVDKVVEYYVKTKDIAKNEIPEVRKLLLSHWKHIEKEIKDID
jgi:hypothetical protein